MKHMQIKASVDVAIAKTVNKAPSVTTPLKTAAFAFNAGRKVETLEDNKVDCKCDCTGCC
jgi:hypothetical protein